MSLNLASGTGILLDDRHGLRNAHCILIVTPEADGKVVVGNITTIYEETADSWKEITMEAGEHPAVSHTSCFPMRFLTVVPLAKLASKAAVANTTTYGRMDPSLHTRILASLVTSKNCPPDVLEFVNKHFGSKKFEIIKACVMDVAAQ